MSGRTIGIAIAAVLLSAFVYSAVIVWEDIRIDQQVINNLQKSCLPSRQEQVIYLGAKLVKPNRMKLPVALSSGPLYCFGNVLMFRKMPDMSDVYVDEDDPLFRGGYPRSVISRLDIPQGRHIVFFDEHPPEVSKPEVDYVYWSSLWIDNDTFCDCEIELLWYYHDGTMNSFRELLPSLTLREFRVPYGTVYLKTRPCGSESIKGSLKSQSVAIQMLKSPTGNEKSMEYCAFLFNVTGKARYELKKL